MARRLKYEKKFTPHQTRQIGEDDAAATSMWKIKRDVRSRLYTQRPGLSPEELDRRVDVIVTRGFSPIQNRSTESNMIARWKRESDGGQ